MTHARRPADSQPSVSEELTAIHPAGIAGDTFVFPLSPAQAKMWLADRARPGNPAYNASFRWRLTGPLDVRILSRALNEIVRRHEILRASFTEIDGNPVQIIAPPIVLNIPVKDLCTLTSADRETQMDRLCLEEATRSFDLEKGPLVRLGLLRMADEDHILMFTLHHIVSDGWSIGLIMEELKNIYTAYAEGRESPLPELPIQYPDYVIWQQGLLGEPDSVKQGEYWKKKLSGYERLEVQTDFPRPADSTTHSAIVSQMLPRELTDAVKEFSNSYGGTMFITTLAACMTLLARYTGKHDIAVGSPLAGRNRTELESLVGLFVNHIVFRSDASGNPAFPEFTARVRDAALEAFANQDVPFENVLKSLSHDGKAAAEPFHLVNFICQREYARASTFVFEFAGIRMSTMPSKSQGALYDLNFFMVEREAGWRLSLEYKTDLYSDKTAQQMLGDFRGLLEAIASNPDRRLSEFSMSERAKPAAIAPADDASSSQSATGEIYVMPASVAQERFWLLANLSPGNPAFHMPACVRLVGPISEPLLEKSFQILIARHETLRTTFEVIDDELAQIISPTSASTFSLPVTFITGGTLASSETSLKELIREEAQKPFELVKGPVFRARLFRIAAEDHVLVITIHHIVADGWSHGVFQRELWTAYEALRERRTPELAPLPIQYSDFTSWQREWLVSAEAREHLEFWTKNLSGALPVLDFPTDHLPSSRPASHGAIETTLLPQDLAATLKTTSKTENVTMFTLMLACFAVLLSREAGQDDLIVGSPMANRRPETESLIGPFAGPVALRLNLSGNPSFAEVIRRASDVTLDALGHGDLPFETLLQNVDLRSLAGRNPLFQFYFSYQAAFLQPRQLAHLTVTPMPTFSVGTPFEMQCAIIERQEGIRIQLEYNPDLYDASTIRNLLSAYQSSLRLLTSNPDFLISELKIRSRSERKPSSKIARLEPGYVAPRDPVEIDLAQIWASVFKVPRVGITDDFFDLGGHSLLAARLLKRIEERLGKELSLASLLDASTIDLQARLIRGDSVHSTLGRTEDTEYASTQIPLFYFGGDPSFRPLSQCLSARREYHNLGMQASVIEALEDRSSLKCIAAYFVRVIRKLRPEGPYMLGGWCSHGLLALEVAQQLRGQGEEVPLVVMMESANPLARMAYSKWKRLVSAAQLKFNLLVREMRRRQASTYVVAGIARAARSFWGAIGPGPHVIRKTPLEVLYEAADNYRPEPYQHPVLLIRSVDKSFGFAQDLRLGWDGLFGDRLEICEVRGNHFSMYMNPNVEGLATAIDTHLKKAEERSRIQ
jgi:non-ribosomal peptide synthetase component F/thioesterase domain-containing protein